MCLRRARALENIFENLPITIQDWERIVGSPVSSPQGLYFGIDMNWRSVQRLVNSPEGWSLLDDAGRAEPSEMITHCKGKSMSDRQQVMFSGDVLKYWKYDGTLLWTHGSECASRDIAPIS